MKISESFSGNYQYNMDAMEKYSLNMNFYPLKNVFIDYIGSFSETGFRKLYDNDDPFKGTLQEQIRHFTDFRFENDNVKAKAFCIYDEMRRDKYTEDVSEDKNKNYNYGVEGNIRFEREGVNVVIGADFVHRASDSGSQLGFHDRNDYALFSQLKISSFNRLILNLGVREQFVDGESGTRDYARFLPCLGANFNAAGHLNFFANSSATLGSRSQTPSYHRKLTRAGAKPGSISSARDR